MTRVRNPIAPDGLMLRAINECGGRDAAALLLGMEDSAPLKEWVRSEADKRTSPSFAQAQVLSHFTTVLAEDLAARCKMKLVPMEPGQCDAEDIVKAMAALSKEFSDVIACLSQAMADRDFTPNEKLAASNEIQHLIDMGRGIQVMIGAPQ